MRIRVRIKDYSVTADYLPLRYIYDPSCYICRGVGKTTSQFSGEVSVCWRCGGKGKNPTYLKEYHKGEVYEENTVFFRLP